MLSFLAVLQHLTLVQLQMVDMSIEHGSTLCWKGYNSVFTIPMLMGIVNVEGGVMLQNET